MSDDDGQPSTDPAIVLGQLPDDVFDDLRAVVNDPGQMKFRDHRRRMNVLIDRAMQVRGER